MPKDEYLKKIYSELKEIKGEVAALRAIVVPEIKLSSGEMAELRKIEAEMKAGREKRLEDVMRSR